MATPLVTEQLLEKIAVFAPEFVLNRMIGFDKDMSICLTSIPHPTEQKTTVAFFPALGLCCATIDYLSSLFTGRIDNGPHVSDIVSYAQKYLPQPDFNDDVIRVLLNSLRHSIAHQGIAKRVWVDKHHGRPVRRIAWEVSDGAQRPSVEIVEQPGEVSHSPWPCHHTHLTHVHLRRLVLDIRRSATAYARDLHTSPALVRNFTKCMKVLYPTT